MNKYVERLYNGIIKENPTFVLMLGMCPTLAVTSSAVNGIGMGLSTTVVLVMSNLLISMFRKVIPNGVRMPAYIVVVASLVTIVQFIMQAYTPALSASLGVYIPLIVVNCIILGRAESYASKNPITPSVFDGLGMGLGFTIGHECCPGKNGKEGQTSGSSIRMSDRRLRKLFPVGYVYRQITGISEKVRRIGGRIDERIIDYSNRLCHCK